MFSMLKIGEMLFCCNTDVRQNFAFDVWLLTTLVYLPSAVCKFLQGWQSYGLKHFLFCPLYVFIYFSAAFCTAHCALGIMHHRNVHYYYCDS